MSKGQQPNIHDVALYKDLGPEPVPGEIVAVRNEEHVCHRCAHKHVCSVADAADAPNAAGAVVVRRCLNHVPLA